MPRGASALAEPKPLAAAELKLGTLGGGSDYVAFLDYLGIPSVDVGFSGPYGVYHSIYDNRNWVARIGDPGFRYHVALVQIWGLMVLRLANADSLPLDYEDYGRRVEEFVNEVAKTWSSPSDLGDARGAARDLREAGLAVEARRLRALSARNPTALEALDRQLMRAERALLDPNGLPGRPWYRHLVFAPKFTYAPEVLPGVTEAVRQGDGERVRAASARLADGLRRAAETLGKR